MLAHQNDCDNGDEMGPETIDVPGGNLTDSGECPVSGETLHSSFDPILLNQHNLKIHPQGTLRWCYTLHPKRLSIILNVLSSPRYSLVLKGKVTWVV